MTTPLSPAAQAVDNAFWKTINDKWNIYDRRRSQLAAALRAVAEHCVPDDSEGHWVYIPHVLAIAAELEAHQND